MKPHIKPSTGIFDFSFSTLFFRVAPSGTPLQPDRRFETLKIVPLADETRKANMHAAMPPLQSQTRSPQRFWPTEDPEVIMEEL